MKSKQTFMLLPLLMMLGLASCTVNDTPVTDDGVETEVDPSSVEEFKPEVLVHIAPLYVAPGVDADLSQAFSWATAFHENSPESASILLLNKLTDVSEAVLQKVLSGKDANTFLVCLVDPVKAEIDAYAESHDWFNIDTDNVNEDLFIYAFNADNHRYRLYRAQEEEDPVAANINRAKNNYMLISSMLSDFQSNYTAGDKETGGSDNGKDNMADFANCYHDQVSYAIPYFSVFRQALWSDPDLFFGVAYVTAVYEIYMAHVYEGMQGAGDYYGVKMNASVSSSDMWKGKGDNIHGGVHVRWVGAYCKSFEVMSSLMRNNNGTLEYIDPSQVMFTAGGTPKPTTHVGETTYEEKSSFGLSTSLTVGGKKGSSQDSDGKSSSSNEISGELSVSANWEWSETVKRDISDVDIALNTTGGNRAGWILTFNNLPEYAWGQTNKFDIKNNVASRSTMDITGVWMWYDKSGKDNQDREPYVLRTGFFAEYGIQSMYSSGADCKETTMVRSIEGLIKLPKMVNETAGRLIIKNDLPSGTTISNIKVLTSDGKEVSEFRNTVPNGGEQILGAYSTKNTYKVTFKARTSTGEVSDYSYSLNSDIELTTKEDTRIYAASDFTAE